MKGSLFNNVPSATQKHAYSAIASQPVTRPVLRWFLRWFAVGPALQLAI
jgi:hypothetical protein